MAGGAGIATSPAPLAAVADAALTDDAVAGQAAGAAAAASPDLAELWQQILAGLELPSTRMLLSQQAQLVRLDDHRAVVRVAGTWMAMVQSRVSLLEGAVARALGSPRQLLLEGASEARAGATALAPPPMPIRPAPVAARPQPPLHHPGTAGPSSPAAPSVTTLPVSPDQSGTAAAAIDSTHRHAPATDAAKPVSTPTGSALPASALGVSAPPVSAPPASAPGASAAIHPSGLASLASEVQAQHPALSAPAASSPGDPLAANASPPAKPASSAAQPRTPAQPAASAVAPAGALNQALGFPSPIDEKAKRLADFFNGEVVELNDSSSAEQNEAA